MNVMLFSVPIDESNWLNHMHLPLPIESYESEPIRPEPMIHSAPNEGESFGSSSAYPVFGGVTGGSGRDDPFFSETQNTSRREIYTGNVLSPSFVGRMRMLKPVPFLAEMSRLGLDPIERNDAKTDDSPELDRRRRSEIVDLPPPVVGRNIHEKALPVDETRMGPTISSPPVDPVASMVSAAVNPVSQNL